MLFQPVHLGFAQQRAFNAAKVTLIGHDDVGRADAGTQEDATLLIAKAILRVIPRGLEDLANADPTFFMNIAAIFGLSSWPHNDLMTQ